MMGKEHGNHCRHGKAAEALLSAVTGRRRGLALTLCLILLLPVAVHSFGKSSPPLQGTFLQLTSQNQTWPVEKWQQLFADLRTLQIRELVVQWTVFDDQIFYRTDNGQPVALDHVMHLAAAANIKVWLGLVYESQFWEQISREPALVEVYLRRLQLRAEEAAAALALAYPRFYGWYLPTEIDDKHWQEHDSREVLFQHLKQLTATLRQIRPGSRVAISGFSNALMDPRTLQHFWSRLVTIGTINVVMFQDGIGAGKLNLQTLPLFLQALQEGVEQQGRRLQVVVELFQQTQAAPFRAVSVPWERVAAQIALAQRFTPHRLMAFSIPDYMTPQSGPAADRLYQDYLHHWQEGGVSQILAGGLE